MARPQVCRFYDDGTTTTALRRPVKRLPEFQNSNGLFYSAKNRRPPSHSTPLQIPRNALLQAVIVVLILFFVFLSNVAPAAHVSKAAISRDVLTAFTSRTAGISSLRKDSLVQQSAKSSSNGQPAQTPTTKQQQQKPSNPAPAKLASGNDNSDGNSGLRVNVPPSAVKKGVSLVAVCMGRHDTIKKTAPAWLAVNAVDEVILVDWSSDPPLEPIVHSLPNSQRINVLRVNNEPSWVLSRAYNLAINSTSYSHVIRTDCDYHIEPNFITAHSVLFDEDKDPKSEKRSFYAGNYNLARNENEVHLNGAVFIRRADFLGIGGYDERIQTYGWDDEDLYNRLADANLTKLDISYDHVSHVEHGNSGRAQTGVKFVTVEIDLNSLLLAKLKPWGPQVAGATSSTLYASANPNGASSNSLEVDAVKRPKSLRELVTAEEYEGAWAEALGRRLHDTYGIPWDIIASLDIRPKEILLRRMMRRSENRERAKRAEMDAAGRTDDMVDVDAIPTPRILLCHCMHGLGNRLRALASCMSFAKETSRELVVLWEPDSHIEARFSDMFKTQLVVLEKFTVKWPFKVVEEYDDAWANFKFHNYMEMEGEGAVKGEIITDIPAKHMYYKGAYIMDVDNSEWTNWDKDNAMLRMLEPVDEVSAMVKALESRGLGSGNMIGLHVRNRTLDKDIKNVDFVKEYGDEATQTMDMWRQKSGVHNFMTLMDSLIKGNNGVRFFVATDTYEVIGELEAMYGERVFAFKRSCDDRDGQCVKFALADLYALSKCKKLYGSNWSSFTEAAMRLGGVKALLAGSDFGE